MRLDRRLDDEQVRVAVLAGLATGMRTEQDHLRARSRISDPTRRLLDHALVVTRHTVPALTWANVGERTLLVERAVAYGKVKSQKTNRPPRTIPLCDPLRQDLMEWRLASGRPSDDAFVFPSPTGGPWPLHDWQNWRRRTFLPAAEALELADTVPYDLRHSFASLLVHEGTYSVVEIAGFLGHAPSMTLSTYAHVLEELRGAEKIPMDELIARARNEIRPISGPRSGSPADAHSPRPRKSPANAGPGARWAIQDSNLGPLPYQRSALTD